MGFAVDSLNRVVSPNGSVHNMATPRAYERKVLVKQVASLADDIAWQNASRHPLGKRLESGIPLFQPAKAARKQMVDRGEATKAVRHEAVVCGALWSATSYRKCRCGDLDT